MAYGGNIYGGGSFSSNCLDDIPFKLGPRFKPPTKVLLPPEIDLSSVSRSKVLQEEYSFEVEEAVLKWSAEKEKQDQIKREKTLKRQAARANKPADSGGSTSSDEPLYENQRASSGEPLYENTGAGLPHPVPKPRVSKPKEIYTNVVIPSPLIANISTDILTPMPSSSIGANANGAVTKRQNSKPDPKSNDFDLTWFEQEDDPFDNLERQTINDMEELASVLKETNITPVNPKAIQCDSPVTSGGAGMTVDSVDSQQNEENGESSDNCEDNVYENVELKMVDLKTKGSKNFDSHQTDVKEVLDFLPPVPPRRDLVGRGAPLPPIGGGNSQTKSPVNLNSLTQVNSDTSSPRETVAEQTRNDDSVTVKNENTNSVAQTFPVHNENVQPNISPKPSAVPKPPRTFRYSRHDFDDVESIETDEPIYDNTKASVSINQSNNRVQFNNSQSSNVSSNSANGSVNSELNFVAHHFGSETGTSGENSTGSSPRPVPPPRPDKPPSPAYRPSSGQAWNRYSPLPPTAGGPPMKVALPGLAKPDSNNAYSNLSEDARVSVDNIVSMGFHKDRVVRAVEKVGSDGKEVVEYLCLVDQLAEKGYNVHLAETALLMFQNSMQQASTYLELFTQLQELGFNGDKIKEALVNTNNDREKTLDILTASS